MIRHLDPELDDVLSHTESGIFRFEHVLTVVEHAPAMLFGTAAVHESHALGMVVATGSYLAVGMIMTFCLAGLCAHLGFNPLARLLGKIVGWFQ